MLFVCVLTAVRSRSSLSRVRRSIPPVCGRSHSRRAIVCSSPSVDVAHRLVVVLVARPSSFVLQLLFHRLPRQLAAFSCSVRPVLQLSLLANRSISSVVVNRSTHRRFDRPPLLSFSCRFVSFSTGRPHSIYVRRRSVSVFNQSTASHLSFSCLNRSTASSLVSWFLSVFQLSSLAVSTGRPHR